MEYICDMVRDDRRSACVLKLRSMIGSGNKDFIKE
jgi:hypothetical protein